MNVDKVALLAVTALFAITLTPNVAAETVDGPFGDCTGLVDAYCVYDGNCQPGASCRLDYCLVYLNGFCPLTRNDILDRINCVIGCESR